MSEDDLGSPATPFRYHVELGQAQLKITHVALHSLLDDFDDEDSEVRAVIEEILSKLPDETAMGAVRLAGRLDQELREREAPDPTSDGDDGLPPAAA